MNPNSTLSRSTTSSRSATRPAVGEHNHPDPRRRLEAALQLLSVYEDQNPAVDDGDLDRFRAATTTLPLPTATLRGTAPQPAAPERGGGKGDQRLKELQKRIFVSDTIMKKLHNKNKGLQREVNALREQIAAGGAVPVTASGDAARELEQYRRDLQQRDARIRELQLYVTELEGRLRDVSHGRAPAPLAAAPAAAAGPPGAPSAAAELRAQQAQAELVATQKKLEGLEQHYQDLLSVKVDSVVNSNASTSQINKEVKLFFVALRKKLHEEFTLREAERTIANERLYLLEKELMARQVNNKLLESQVRQGQ